LGVLAMVGVGYLLATAIGFVQVAPRSGGGELSKAFVDSLRQGLLVTDARGRVVYANRAYGDLTGASSATDLRTLESILSDLPDASTLAYRLAKGLKQGEPGEGEFRLQQSLRPGGETGSHWYRVQARRFSAPGHGEPLRGWLLGDISSERAEQ